MQASISYLVTRDDAASSNRTMFHLVIALLVLVFFALLLVGVLLLLRRSRRARLDDEEDEVGLPEYEEKAGPRSSNYRRLTVTAAPFNQRSEPIYVYQERQDLIANSSSPPSGAIPEIRITFPEEVDGAGKRQSGRVVVVRVGDHSVGLEPVQEDLPPYQDGRSDRFQSLDLDRIGGLKEKI